MNALAGAATVLLLAFGGSAASPGTIVFAADRMPQVSGDVFRADANGSVVNLTHSPWQDTNPVVSPNGKLVAFLSDRDGGGLWTIGADGRGLRRIVAVGLPSEQQVGMAWAPDGSELALVTGTTSRITLSLVGPGRKPHVLAHDTRMGPPTWSPDGKLVTVAQVGAVDAYTVGGTRAWNVTSGSQPVGWSKQGLFATGPYVGSVHVVDEQGNARFSVAATSAAWSPDGSRLASVNGRRLTVHSSAGRLLLGARLPVPDANITWASAAALVVPDPFGGLGFRVAVPGGRITRIDTGSLGLNTAASGTSFAVRDGTHVYTHVIGCNDDGGPVAAIASLQRVPHSTSLVYESDCAEPFDNLYSVAPGGTDMRRITNDQAQETVPQLSPDGSTIAYDWADATGLSCKGCATSVRTLRLDGSARATLTTPPDCTFDDSPTWSPSGTQIAFSHSACDTAPDLMTIAASGGTPKDLHVPAWQVAWGPTRIAYLNGTTVPSSIWTVNPDGTGKQHVGGGDVSSPTWSQDGRLAYLVGTSAVVAGKKTPLPFQQVRSLAWSPDGTRFVVAAKPKGAPTFDVYVVKIDGTDPVQLTHDLDASSADWR